MLSSRAILTVRCQPERGGDSAARHLRSLLRYLEVRDQSGIRLGSPDLGGLIRHAASRNLEQPAGPLFGPHGPVGRRQGENLYRYVLASSQNLARYPPRHSNNRAFYLMVISPEDGTELNLRHLSRAVMSRLGHDLAPLPLPPWVGAEHYNTAHPHAHIALAGRRQGEGRDFKTVIITRSRLARMKTALRLELERQRSQTRQLARPEWSLDRRQPQLPSAPEQWRCSELVEVVMERVRTWDEAEAGAPGPAGKRRRDQVLER
ncbi:MAG: hypothetical protein ACRENM_03760 [Candidatus Dormibacteraceae bacterium]